MIDKPTEQAEEIGIDTNEQPVLLTEETPAVEPVAEVVEEIQPEPEPEEKPEPEPDQKVEVKPEPTNFVVKVDGKYLFKWSGKVFVSDIKNAKVFNKANAEYFQKEINAEIIPVE